MFSPILRKFCIAFQTSDALLELAVLGGVDERVDAAVGQHQHHGEVVVPVREVDRVAEKVEKEQDFGRRPANDESTADDERRDQSIAPGFVHQRTNNGAHLTETTDGITAACMHECLQSRDESISGIPVGTVGPMGIPWEWEYCCSSIGMEKSMGMAWWEWE